MRENWRELAPFPALFVGTLIGAFFTSGFLQVMLAWVNGCTAMAFAAGWIMGFDATTLPWRWGAQGEPWTEEELRKLDPSWSVYHDIAHERGNWDHVVVGPSGVFLLETRTLSGPIKVENDELRSGRIRSKGAAARGAAVGLKQALEQRTGRAVWVQSVVVLWGDFPQGLHEENKIVYLSARRLIDWLGSLPPRLTPEVRELIAFGIQAVNRDAGASPSPAER